MNTLTPLMRCEKLHTKTLDKVKIMYVAGVGKREVATILSCEDFNGMTTKGSVVVTEKHWVTVNRHDADVIHVTKRSVCTSAMLNT